MSFQATQISNRVTFCEVRGMVSESKIWEMDSSKSLLGDKELRPRWRGRITRKSSAVIQTQVPLVISVFLKFIYLIEVWLIYNVVLISAVHQSDPVICIYILFHILFHYGLSQDTEYTVVPCAIQ